MGDGWKFQSIDEQRADAGRVKLQYHRDGLTFRCEGIWFKANLGSAPVRNTDYSPRNFATTVKTAADAAATVINVNSVKGFAKYQLAWFDRGGAGEESHYITAIDVSAKTITLQEGLTNSQAVGKSVDMDRVKVSYSNGVTTVDFIIGGQNATAALAGADIQFATAWVDETIKLANHDRLDGKVIVPLGVGSEVVGGLMCDETYMVSGIAELHTDSDESASAIDPNYVLRMVFTSAEVSPTPKEISVKFGVWRV